MKYLYAILLMICGLVPIVGEGDGTLMLLMLIPIVILMFTRKNWLGEPREEEDV